MNTIGCIYERIGFGGCSHIFALCGVEEEERLKKYCMQYLG